MKKIDMLRAASLACIFLLSVSLAAVAHAGHNHDRGNDSVIISHVVHRDHDTRRGRYKHNQRPGNFHDERHYGYREQTRHHHPHQVSWQRPFNPPRLVIRLPWLLFVNY